MALNTLYSTHYLTEVEQLAASVVVLDQGRVIARGSVAQLIAAHASSIVEFAFESAVPPLDTAKHGGRWESEGSVLRVHTHEPGAVTAAVLEDLGSRVGELQSLEVVRPSLETVYLELTGRRYQYDTPDETDNVA